MAEAENAEKNSAQAGGAGTEIAGGAGEQKQAAEAGAGEQVQFTDSSQSSKDGAGTGAGAQAGDGKGTAVSAGTGAGTASGTAPGTGTKKDMSEADREKNAKAARERRQAEEKQRIEAAEARARAEAEVSAVIEALDGKNPYTGAPMKDAADVKQYRTMKAIKARGGDPLQDYPGEVAREVREAEQKRRDEDDVRESARKDLESFRERYPSVDPSALLDDADFSDYAEGKVGKKSLSEIYEGYLRITGKVKKAADERAAQALANRESGSAAAGSVAQTGAVPPVTPQQFHKMGYEQREKLFRENPELYKSLVGR